MADIISDRSKIFVEAISAVFLEMLASNSSQ